MPTVKINDLLIGENNLRALVNAMYAEEVEALLLDEGEIQPGMMFKKTNSKLTIEAGSFLLGRAVNPLGVPIDGKGSLKKTSPGKIEEIDKIAPGIAYRKFIKEQFDTNITLIDTLIPLGLGQRELIMGDARSGKTGFLIDLIVNQKGTGTVCIYGSIGKPITSVKNLINILAENNALDHTLVIATSSTDISPLIYLTPHATLTVAEYFQRQGKNVLVILDDMGTHAKIYREISLLGNKSPGKESYPGDIFYQHAHLLERAGNFNDKAGGGSITALPIIELNLNDFTTLIPTNLMGMTDGHLLFKADLYRQGQRPPIDLNLSVSRVGKQTQERLQNNLAYKIKQILTQASQLETVSRFSSEVSQEAQLILKQSQLIMEILRQEPLTSIQKPVQTVLLSLVFTPFLQNRSVEFLKIHKHKLISVLSTDKTLQKLMDEIFKLTSPDDLIKILTPYLTYLDKLCQA